MKKNKEKQVSKSEELINNIYPQIRHLAYDLCMMEQHICGKSLWYTPAKAKIDLLQELLHTFMDKTMDLGKILYDYESK